MRSQFTAFFAACGLSVGAVAFATSAAIPPNDATHAADAAHGNGNWKTIQAYCYGCHNTDDWAGGIAFDSMSPDGIPQDAKIWEQAVRKLRGGMMPPPGHKRPDNATIKNLVSYLETTLDNGNTHPDPGRVPMSRLNRREYANAVHDLIGLDVDGAAWLPQDPVRDGFDTDAQLLQVTPNFLDQSVAAARALALEAVGDPKAAPIDTTYGNIANMIISLNPRPGVGTGNQEKYQDGMPFGTRGGMVAEHWFAADGEYSLTIGDMAMAREVPKLEFENTVLILLDGKEIHRVTLGGEKDYKDVDQNLDAGVYHINSRLRDIRFHATAGQHKVAVTFLRRSYAESDERVRPNTLDGGQQRVNAVHAMQIKGPIKVTGMSLTPSRALIFICTPASAAEEAPCAQKIIANLAQHAFRRPVTDEDMQPLLAFYQKGRQAGTFDTGIRDALAAILASPDFLYRAEAAGDTVRTLNDYELASRMSFFIWSSLPDQELLDLAAKNELSKPEVLKAQVHRMLADPRALTLTTDFAFQWLNIAKMDTISPAQAAVQLRRRPVRSAAAVQEGADAVHRQHPALGSQRRGSAHRRPHLCQRGARAALRHAGREGRRVPPHHAHRSEPLRPAGQGRGADDHGQSGPHRTGAARCVDPGAHPGHAADPAADGRADPDRDSGRQGHNRARAHRGPSPQPALLRLPCRHGSAGLRARELRHASASSAPSIRRSHMLIDTAATLPDGTHMAGPDGPAQGTGRARPAAGPDDHREADDLRGGPPHGITATCPACAASCARPRRRITALSPSSWVWCKAMRSASAHLPLPRRRRSRRRRPI